MERTCSVCGQSIPPKSKLAQVFAGKSREELLVNLPKLAAPESLPLKTAPDGMLWIEVCMSCWIHTGPRA